MQVSPIDTSHVAKGLRAWTGKQRVAGSNPNVDIRRTGTNVLLDFMDVYIAYKEIAHKWSVV